MNTTKTLQEFFNELSSNSPTPGGGNVAALCGALSSSLGIMVCNLTIGKKKYVEFEQEMISLKAKLENIQKCLDSTWRSDYNNATIKIFIKKIRFC